MRKILIVTFIVIIIAGAAAAGVFAYRYYAPKPAQSPNNETAGWKTYTNSQYGFSFQYPQTNSTKSVFNDENEIRLPIFEEGKNTNIDAKVIHIEIKPTVDNQCENGAAITKTENVEINGIPFKKDTGGEGAAGHGYQYIAYTTLKNNSCITLNFIVSSFNDLQLPVESGRGTKPFVPYNFAEESVVFNQIILTFKFLGTLEQTGSNSVITVESPNGGEVFYSKSPIAVSWLQNYTSDSVKVLLMSRNAGSVYMSSRINGKAGKNTFVIPGTADKKICSEPDNNLNCYLDTGYKVQVLTDAPPGIAGEFLSDNSDGYFTITSMSPSTDWETFNHYYGISFNYPRDWGMAKNIDIPTRTTVLFPNGSISQYDNGFYVQIGTFSPREGAAGYQNNDLIPMSVQEIVNSIKDRANIANFTQQDIILSGKRGVRVDYNYVGSDLKTTEIYLALDKKGNILNISSDTALIGTDIFDQVLSSLKFTN